MNEIWLNIPLCIAIATALVAPLLVVISREPLGDPLTVDMRHDVSRERIRTATGAGRR
jgi:hypothetical protein